MLPRELTWKRRVGTGMVGNVNNIRLFITYYDDVYRDVERRWRLITYLPIKLKQSRFLNEDAAMTYANHAFLYFWAKITRG